MLNFSKEWFCFAAYSRKTLYRKEQQQQQKTINIEI